MPSAFQKLLSLAESQRYPPVDTWRPTREGCIDIQIKRDGRWFHEGREIKRKGLVKIFASILKREGEFFYLVTPEEKLRIQVDDAPFIAVDFEVAGSGSEQRILFQTNLEDVVLLGTDHPLRITVFGDEIRPYIEVRDGLQALIARSAFYRLVDYASEDGDDALLTSAGATFRIS